MLTPQSLTYTLHSMEPDGSDIVSLSFHETNEWQPTVSHEGKIAYTRWDYVDRHWGTAHHFWECFPDGRDPRNFHGNYPLPWSAMPEGVQPAEYGRRDRDLVYGRVLAARRGDILPPGSRFAEVHGHRRRASRGFLRKPGPGGSARPGRRQDGAGEADHSGVFLPGSGTGRHVYAYGTAWPLSEDFYLCNFNFGLYCWTGSETGR